MSTRARSRSPLTWRDTLGRLEYRWSPYLYIAPFFIVFAVTLMILEPDLPTRSILFETVSATFNVGSSMGITSMLSDASKFVMCVAMFLGRVGLISVLTGMFTLRRDASAYYPEDDVIIN